jgi:hypothetical protein
MTLDCPLPAALTAIPQPTCPFKMDQIVRLAFQRRQPIGTPAFTTLVLAQTLAEWTDYKAAVDSTKVVMSPIFTGFVIPNSEALTTGGGDNSTFNGIREYNGEGAVTVTGVFKNLPPASKNALELLSQESLASSVGVSNLTVFMWNRSGYGFANNPSGTIYQGIPVYNFRVSTRGTEGFNAPDTVAFSFDLPGDWDAELVSFLPGFDPLTEI